MGEQNVSTSTATMLKAFNELDQRINHYNEILQLAGWDLQTGAPKKGKALRSNAIGTLFADSFELAMSDQMKECIDYLSEPSTYEELDEISQSKVRERKRDFYKFNKIPSDLYKQFTIDKANAHDVWEEAKNTNNFALFEPTLEKMVGYMNQFVDYYGYEEHPYDALLDLFEPNLTVKKVDPIFAELRKQTVELLDKIRNSNVQLKTEIFNQPFSVDKQRELCLAVLPKLGYDMEAGRLDVSAHPFASGINLGDVRITTRYLENDFRSALLSTIHECGHAIYEQGILPEFAQTVIGEGSSMGIHESQSRFLENMIGRSYEFWSYLYPQAQALFPEQLHRFDLNDVYGAVNEVKSSFIRVEADEVTYNLHIMIRYEIEKALIAGEIKVKDLPEVWNSKMEEYLGVRPDTDAEGVLQDVHWSFGGFGYFPSYALGNLYAAQFAHTLEKEIPNYLQLVGEGNFAPIREWLRTNIHQHGKRYSPDELIQRVTGEELKADYLVSYFKNKYTKLYQLEY